jgi:hypothetical protein
MKKITLSFQLLAAIVAVTILQVCAGTARGVPPPTLNPSTEHVTCTDGKCNNGRCPVTVTITTTPEVHYLVFWFDNSQVGPVKRSPVTVTFPTTRSGRKLKAKAIKGGHYSSTAVGTYYCN